MNYLSGLGMDHNSFMRDWSMDFLDELNSITYDHHQQQQQQQQQQQPMMSHKHEYTETSPNDQAEFGYNNRPVKQQKSSSWSTNSSSNSQDNSPKFHVVNSSYHVQTPLVKPKEEEKSSSFTLNFAPPNGVLISPYDFQFENQNHAYKASQGAKRIVSPNPDRIAQAQDHIIAERKRREKLSQRFIAMSALLPGLKKMDKASVLGDAIKYIKQLQEKVTTLEDSRKKSIETAVFMRKNRVCEDGNNDFSDEPLPQIEAKVCKKDVLIRVHCEKIKGIQEAIVAEIEKLNHLAVMNSCSLTFGDSTLDITIIAKMEEQFTMPMKDLVMHLSSALKRFM